MKRKPSVSIWIDADSVEFEHDGKAYLASGVVDHECHHVHVNDNEWEWHSKFNECDIRDVTITHDGKEVEATNILLEFARHPMWEATYESAEQQAWDT